LFKATGSSAGGYMKKSMIIALLCACRLVSAESLLLGNGTEYRNVTIISADPVRMLIVHDGGGCQVDYTELAPNALSAQQRKTVEVKLAEHVERTARIKQLQLEQKAYEQAQREKGLILFEGDWMKPADRQEILASRELDRLEQERLRVKLEKEKLELRKAQRLAEEGDRLLEAPKRSTYTYYYSYPVRSTHCGCRDSRHCSHSSKYYRSGNWNSSCRTAGGLSLSFSSSGNSISYSTGVHSGLHSRSRSTCR